MADERALDLGRAEAMAGDVENVIDPTHYPKITILVATRAVAGEIIPFDFTPVLLR